MSSLGPPRMAVLPSADREAERPTRGAPAWPNGCRALVWLWLQRPLLRVKTHAPPMFDALFAPALFGPPTTAVSPSADRATETPCRGVPETFMPISLACWLHTPTLRVKTHVAPWFELH